MFYGKKFHFKFFPLEIKALQANGYFAGYALVYDHQDYHNDIIVHGAFGKPLQNNPDIRLLWQHEPESPIGYFNNIFEDKKGLYVEGYINLETEKGLEAYSLLKTKVLDGLSVGFTVSDFEIEGDPKPSFGK